MKLPNINRDWLIVGGIAILGAATLIQLHNVQPAYVPTVPGLKYGSGSPATGFYTGDSGPTPATNTATPVPYLNAAYQRDIRPVSQTIQADIRKGVAVALPQDTQAMWGAWSEVGRGALRDRWTDVYNPSTVSSKITGDDPTVRVSLA